MKVAVLGASDKPQRYSYKAIKMLEDHDHDVYPVHPRLKQIEGRKVYTSLSEIDDRIDTLTVYISPEHSNEVRAEIAGLRPRRVIFNPGAENPNLIAELRVQGIDVVEACTLVMLQTGQF